MIHEATKPACGNGDGNGNDIALDENLSRRVHVVSRLERTVTLLMLGRLTHHGSDTICRIRNVSSGGMRLDTGSPLHKGDRVAVEGRSGMCVEGQVAWTSHLAAGVAFSQNVDHPELLAPPTGPSGARVAARSPRFRATARARLNIGGRVFNIRLVDISLGGCRVESDASLPRGVEGFLTVSGLPPLACASRWTTSNSAGLVFPARIEFADFARWLEQSTLRFCSEPVEQRAPSRMAFATPGSMPVSRPRSF